MTPVVVTFGSYALQAQRAQLWAALDAGAAVHLVNLRSGVHRGWLTAGCEPGYETTPIGCGALGAHMGEVLEAVRNGTTFEITDHQAGEVRGYLTWCPPRPIAEDPALTLRYMTRARRGTLARELLREFASANVTQARAVGV